jgi:hypothetical protein
MTRGSESCPNAVHENSSRKNMANSVLKANLMLCPIIIFF